MRTGTVIVTDLGGTGNKIFHSGDKVNERQFPLNNWDPLVAGGFIKEDEPAAAEAEPAAPELEESEVPEVSEEEAEKPAEQVQTSKRGKRNRK